nr:PREDICTED: heat shock transcription factor, Y-linked-like [Bos indicus]
MPGKEATLFRLEAVEDTEPLVDGDAAGIGQGVQLPAEYITEEVEILADEEQKAPFRIFETKSMKSLIRQLNLYGFSKKRQTFQRSASLPVFLEEENNISLLSKLQTYYNPNFKRGHPQLLLRHSSYTQVNGPIEDFATTTTSTSQNHIVSPLQSTYSGLMVEPSKFPSSTNW